MKLDIEGMWNFFHEPISKHLEWVQGFEPLLGKYRSKPGNVMLTEAPGKLH